MTLIDWVAEFVELSWSPVLEIPAFLRRPFIRGKKVKHPIPEEPVESIHKEKCLRTKAQRAWTYLCALLQFWMDEAMTESGEVMYGGRHQPANPMIARIRAILNPSFGEHFEITWASIAASTSWTQARLYFGDSELERFQSEPGPTADLWNPLENTVEERLERFLKEGRQEMPDLSFSTPFWAGADSKPSLPSGQPGARHLMEAESVPPGFTRLDRKTSQEQEATTKYRTLVEAEAGVEQGQTIDEELGAHEVTTINKAWYAPTEAEVASAVLQNILDSAQPMEVDQEERPYQMFDVSDVLGPDQGPSSPITAKDDNFLDLPSGFSRAPGDGRPPTGSPARSSSRRITGRTEEHKWMPG